MKKLNRPETASRGEPLLQFDPHDHKAMVAIMDNYAQYRTMGIGKNEDGEMTTSSVYQDKIIIDTYQNNGWVRRNIYHRDGTREELFDGKWV